MSDKQTGHLNSSMDELLGITPNKSAPISGEESFIKSVKPTELNPVEIQDKKPLPSEMESTEKNEKYKVPEELLVFLNKINEERGGLAWLVDVEIPSAGSKGEVKKILDTYKSSFTDDEYEIILKIIDSEDFSQTKKTGIVNKEENTKPEDEEIKKEEDVPEDKEKIYQDKMEKEREEYFSILKKFLNEVKNKKEIFEDLMRNLGTEKKFSSPEIPKEVLEAKERYWRSIQERINVIPENSLLRQYAILLIIDGEKVRELEVLKEFMNFKERGILAKALDRSDFSTVLGDFEKDTKDAIHTGFRFNNKPEIVEGENIPRDTEDNPNKSLEQQDDTAKKPEKMEQILDKKPDTPVEIVSGNSEQIKKRENFLPPIPFEGSSINIVKEGDIVKIMYGDEMVALGDIKKDGTKINPIEVKDKDIRKRNERILGYVAKMVSSIRK